MARRLDNRYEVANLTIEWKYSAGRIGPPQGNTLRHYLLDGARTFLPAARRPVFFIASLIPSDHRRARDTVLLQYPRSTQADILAPRRRY